MKILVCKDCGRVVKMTEEKFKSHREWDCQECKGSLISIEDLNTELPSPSFLN